MVTQPNDTLRLPDREVLFLATARGSQYTAIMGITLGANIALLFLNLIFVSTLSTGPRVAVAMTVLTVTAFGALAGKSALDDIRTHLDDYMAGNDNGHFATNTGQQPYKLFTVLTVLLVVLLGLAQAYLVFAL